MVLDHIHDFLRRKCLSTELVRDRLSHACFASLVNMGVQFKVAIFGTATTLHGEYAAQAIVRRSRVPSGRDLFGAFPTFERWVLAQCHHIA